jgi:uncharacterized membrane protein
MEKERLSRLQCVNKLSRAFRCEADEIDDCIRAQIRHPRPECPGAVLGLAVNLDLFYFAPCTVRNVRAALAAARDDDVVSGVNQSRDEKCADVASATNDYDSHGVQENTSRRLICASRRTLNDPTMLTGVHFHLLVNHSPIFGSLFALVLFIASYFTARDVLRRTALVVLIASAITGAAADLSGESAEHALRGIPGVRHDDIEAHQHMGDKAYYMGDILGVLALVALIRWRSRPVPTSVTHVAVLATAFVAGAFIYTGLLGGRIRHTEIRPGATPADALIVEPPRQRRPRPPGD